MRSYQLFTTLPLFLAAVSAGPITIVTREVPQEHSHERILRKVDELLALDNPNQIQAAVFGLLGAAAAAGGAGLIEDPDCLQQATADQAFTNAKAAGDVEGQVAALIFRALERNTGQVGLESVLCESLEAVNPEIAALQQHQDPAAEGAAELNKAIAEELVRQIIAVGGDPLDANVASTFAPGELGDPTAAGNTCNDENDVVGCIETLGLRVDDLSPEEIQAIVDSEDGAGAVVGAGNVTDINAGKACNATQIAAGKDKKAKNKNQNKDNKKQKQNKDKDNNKAAKLQLLADKKAQLLQKLDQKKQVQSAKAVIADLLSANKKLLARKQSLNKKRQLSFGN